MILSDALILSVSQLQTQFRYTIVTAIIWSLSPLFYAWGHLECKKL